MVSFLPTYVHIHTYIRIHGYIYIVPRGTYIVLFDYTRCIQGYYVVGPVFFSEGFHSLSHCTGNK